MGLVEDIAGHLSLKNVPFILGGLLFGYIVLKHLQVAWQNFRINRMGLRPLRIQNTGLYGE